MIGSPPARGRRRSATRRAAGFTLIEVMVVVAIAGILVTLAAVNLFPSDAQVARREAGLVALAVEHARDAAWFGGRPTAITLSDARVREWRLAADDWKRDATREHALEASVKIAAIYADGEPLKLDDRLVFLPDGLATPFRIALEVRGLPWAIEGDASGAITLVEP